MTNSGGKARALGTALLVAWALVVLVVLVRAVLLAADMGGL